MKKNLKLFCSLPILIGFFGCGQPKEKADNKLVKDTAIALPSELMDSVVNREPDFPQNQDSLKAEIEKLKKNFKYSFDDIRGIGWYTHKSQQTSNSWNRTCLIAHVRNDGYIYMEDQYYAEDWLFHESITVKVGDSVLYSESVSTFDPNNKTENSGGSIWETISYSDASNGILKIIAETKEEKIKIRFNGREYYDDKILSAVDKKAITEAYNLSESLKKLKP